MNEIIFVLRIVYIGVLLWVTISLANTGFRAFTKRIQIGDVEAFLFAGMAFNRLWFLARSLHFQDEVLSPWEAGTLGVCYIFAIALELVVLRRHAWRKP